MMEFLFGYWPFTVVAPIIAGTYLFGWLRGAPVGYHPRLRLLADLVSGTVVSRNSTVGGHVIFHRRGLPFYVYEKIIQSSRWTIISADATGWKLPSFQIRPSHGIIALPAPRGFDPISAERVGLDPSFHVLLPTNSGSEFPFTARVADGFQALALLVAEDGPVLEVQGDRCRLYLPGILCGRERQAALLTQGCTLLESILQGPQRAASESSGKAIDVLCYESRLQAICRVCGEVIPGQPARCASCRTPHHPECWEYIGECSTFGCGCKECKR